MEITIIKQNSVSFCRQVIDVECGERNREKGGRKQGREGRENKIGRGKEKKRGKERKKRGRTQKKEGALLGKPSWELNFGYVWDLLPCTDLC